MEENKNDTLKAPLVSTSFTIKGLRVLLAFSFVATILAFSVAFVEHRQYTELVERYDDAIVKISEYQSSVVELVDNTVVTEAVTNKAKVTTTKEPKTTESKCETYTEKTTNAKAQKVTTARTETTQSAKETTVKAEKSSTYYVTQSGAKYHVASCSYLSKSKIAITMDRIKAEGYTPCSRCIK